MIQVVKRDGETAEFCLKKITEAIKKAFRATGNEFNDEILELLSLRVTADFQWRRSRTAWSMCWSRPATRM